MAVIRQEPGEVSEDAPAEARLVRRLSCDTEVRSSFPVVGRSGARAVGRSGGWAVVRWNVDRGQAEVSGERAFQVPAWTSLGATPRIPCESSW